ncbi:MAG: recombination protein O N-terminal domain-containing protein [Parcubacteria group bacterium]
MSYHIYTTPAVVLSHRPLREADRVYSVLTRDLGLIRATAIGVRKETSKLRHALEPLSFSSISFVRGKEYWRITSAVFEKRVQRELAEPMALLEKLVVGEDAHPELFEEVENEVLNYNREDEMAEVRLVSKILFHLGYMEEGGLDLPKKDLIKSINRGIEVSGLAS